MQMTIKDVHIAMLYVAGPVTKDNARSPDKCAKAWLELYLQDKKDWKGEMTLGLE